MAFSGFDSKSQATGVPEQFFTELLAQVNNLAELKLTLYLLWQQEQQEGPVIYFLRTEIAADAGFMQGLGDKDETREAMLDEGLAQAVDRGTLLKAELADGNAVYLIHSPRGRAAMHGLTEGKWSPRGRPRLAVQLGPERPNIFQLYEQNIGPLTPMLAESLREAEGTYPADWIEDALRIALENNVRKWRYVEAILKSWQEKGRDDRKDQQGAEKDQRKYVEGEFSDFIER